MDNLERYRELIKNYINQHLEMSKQNSSSAVQDVAILDDQGGHYQLLGIGWNDGKRAFYTYLYARLCNGKVWIEKDFTEYGLGNDLVDNGVPKSDIVLAFHSPEERKLTEFAVA